MSNVNQNPKCLCSVETGCCPGISIPNTLIATDGANSVTLTFRDPGDSKDRWWNGTGFMAGCQVPPDHAVEWSLVCRTFNGVTYFWVFQSAFGVDSPVTGTCSPLMLQRSFRSPCDGQWYTVTITEA